LGADAPRASVAAHPFAQKKAAGTHPTAFALDRAIDGCRR